MRRPIITSASALLAIACGAPAPTLEPDRAPVPVGTVHGYADPARGVLELSLASPQGLVPLNVVQDGSPGLAGSHQVEAVTLSVGAPGPCGPGEWGGTVQINSSYSGLTDLVARIHSMSPPNEVAASNSDGDVPGVPGGGDLFGTWTYPGGPGTAEDWCFQVLGGGAFQFTAGIYGTPTGGLGIDEVFEILPGTLAIFEYNGGTLDTSGNGNHGVNLGSGFVPTSFGQGLALTGDPQGMDWTAAAGRTQLDHPFTLEFVVRVDNQGGYRKLFSFNDGSDSGMYLDPGNGFIDYPQAGVGGGLFVAGQRYYIAVRSLSPTTAEVLNNGSSLGTITLSNDYTSAPPNAVFWRDDSGTGRGERLDGIAEALRISSVTRTDADLAAVQARLLANP